METRLKAFEECLGEVTKLKSKVEELMLEREKTIEYTEEWSNKHETEIQENGYANRGSSKRDKRTEAMRNEEGNEERNIRRGSDWGRVPSTQI